MKKVLITGCNGQLGRALNQIIDSKQVTILNTDVSDLDICDYNKVKDYVLNRKPDTIINCAAHTAVDKCETDRENAYRINAIGPKNLAMAASLVNAEIVQVSTDYVFAGTNSIPYVETDVPNPQSVYGSTKLQGEKEVMGATQKYYIVRTAWLYGDGNNFVRTMLRLGSEKKQLSVVNDQFGTPTSALELARMIVHILNHHRYGIYHATCEGMTSWYLFAKRIFEKADMQVDVTAVTTDEYPAAAAKRPSYSVLDNQVLNNLGTYRMKNWEDALDEYLNVELTKGN